jgi:integrase
MAKQARLLEAKALEQIAEHGNSGDETCDSFAARWTRDYPRGESTNKTREERVRKFAQDFKGRTLRSVTRQEARVWARGNSRTRVPAVRAMFTDALDDGLVDFNPFTGMRNLHEGSKGRADIRILSADELGAVAATAVAVLAPEVGPEMRAMILWGAYTCMRPGEIYAARYSLLSDDVYDLQRQFNSKLRKETNPKHDSKGAIFVPEPARAAVFDKPRRLGDDLMFRTPRGKQFSTGSMNYYWNRVAAAAGFPNMDFYELRHFGASYMLNELEMEPWVIAQQLRHADGGRLVVTLYGHPDRKKALEIIRRTYEPPRPVEIHERRAEGT